MTEQAGDGFSAFMIKHGTVDNPRDPILELPAITDLVILESPYAGDVERNIIYARRALRDSINRGEAPMASHLLYTQVLDDTTSAERRLGIALGLRWREVATRSVVYEDYGISSGMQFGIDLMRRDGKPIEYRLIGRNP